jgi:hypothetical protein
MLPLKDQKEIASSLASMRCKSSVCVVSGCSDTALTVYGDSDDRELPMCDVHYGLISSQTLW